MKIVKVTYTTKPEMAAQNIANIKTVMSDLQELSPPGIFYDAFLGPDGKTFTHIAFFKSEEDRHLLGELASFKHFQEELRSGKPEVPPQQELLTWIGSSRPENTFQ